MIKSNITLEKEAIQDMMEGIRHVTSLIRTTYGPKGKNVSVENEFYPFHEVANDAQTIIQASHVEGQTQKRGLNFLKELSNEAHLKSGDGRKTTCIIGEEILDQGFAQGLDNKEEFDGLIKFIEQKIDEVKTNITVHDIGKVASIAGDSKEMGQILQDIYQKIGAEGIIIPEASGTYNTYCTVIEGVRFVNTGYLSPFMVHDEESVKEGKKETKAIYKNPTILVTKRKISHINDIDPLLSSLQNNGKKDLIIFTDDMDSGVASVLVNTHKAKVMNILIIKAPVLWKSYIFEDFAKVTGATIVEDASGINFKNLPLSALGTCESITVDKDETIVIGGMDISDHIQELKDRGDNDSKLRLSWLTTKTALLKLGANNESELSHKRLKCNDAINSSKLALHDGVVLGGGVCLSQIADSMPETPIGEVLRKALKAPLEQNLKNMGIESPNWGEEIVDASMVIKNAVRNAIALASTVLTLGGDIALPEKSAEQIAADALKSKGLRF